jgi:hypothetical protein
MSILGLMVPGISVILAKQTSAVAQAPRIAGIAASGVCTSFAAMLNPIVGISITCGIRMYRRDMRPARSGVTACFLLASSVGHDRLGDEEKPQEVEERLSRM